MSALVVEFIRKLPLMVGLSNYEMLFQGSLMKIVYSWLKDFVDIDIPVGELADALTGAGLEVASIQHISIPDKIIVAKILEVNRHPNADRLTVCKVDIGESAPLTIVCGAPNTRQGMLAPLATIGAKLGPDVTRGKSETPRG